MALMRNPQTPVASVVAFLPNITLRDLKDISRLKGLAPYRKKYILQELEQRADATVKPARKRRLC
jgi:hypothetical protein